MSGRSVVVVCEQDSTGEAVADALTAADGLVVERVASATLEANFADSDVDDPDVDDPDAVFAVGEPSLLALAERAPDCPVFPVAVGADRYDIPASDLDAAIDAFLTDAFETVGQPVLAVTVGDDRAGHALADVTLMTADPARISEYAVRSPDGWVDTVRADGVVVATPLGSAGYARAAGGPLLAPETGLTTVPISPYAIHAPSWVLRPPVSLSVERDEADVSLLLDDDVVRSVPAGAPVDIEIGQSLPVVHPQTLSSV